MSNGSQHSLYIVPESTYNAAVATPALEEIRHTGCTLGLSKNANESSELRSDRQRTDFRHGTKQVGGDIPIELSYGSFDTILEALLGGTWATDTPIAGTDQLDVGTTRRSFNILRHFGDLAAGNAYHLFTGCEFNTLSLNVTPEGIVTGSVGVVGADLSLAATAPAGATYPAVSTTQVFDSFTGTIDEGGSSIAIVTAIDLALANGLAPRYAVGSAVSLQPQIGRSIVNGTLTAYFENTTLLAKFIDETESDLDLTLTDLAGNDLRIFLPAIKYVGGQPDVSDEGSITLAMPFEAIYDSTTTTNMRIERNAA